MNREIELFIRDYTKEIQEDNAAIFAGAGLSIPAGYVNWSQLLKPVADELGLDINKENDLVTLAQYYCNENQGNRNRINQLILAEFSQQATLTENHKILSRLPISTFWTTNYDKLIEKSLEQEGKIPDVKYTVNQLAVTKPKRDAIVYKMHGDVDHSDSAVIIKDDYETYFIKMRSFITALSGDLVSKTFLFLGLSFTDPNLDYILSRVRSTYNQHQRRHYCLMKKVVKREDESVADFEYNQRKQELFINDLKRFNIKTLVLDNYEEITSILTQIERNLKKTTIFISGSADNYGTWNPEDAEYFIHLLSKELIKNNFNIVSGFGLGVGSLVISGALEEIYFHQGKINNERLILRPFPQSVSGNHDRQALWKKYREDMLARTGISLFIFGNKLESNKIIPANGVVSEFEIAHNSDNIVVPVGATGFVSKELWERVKNDFSKYYPFEHDANFISTFDNLNNDKLTNVELVSEVIKFIKMIS
nr:SIR2 family protein [Paenibacillus xylanexedens]